MKPVAIPFEYTVDVAKAYWGLKLAREIHYTVKEGQGHLLKALKKVSWTTSSASLSFPMSR